MSTEKPACCSLEVASWGDNPTTEGMSFTSPRTVLSSGCAKCVVGMPLRAPLMASSQIGPATPEPETSEKLSLLPSCVWPTRVLEVGCTSATTEAAASLLEYPENQTA